MLQDNCLHVHRDIEIQTYGASTTIVIVDMKRSALINTRRTDDNAKNTKECHDLVRLEFEFISCSTWDIFHSLCSF